VFVRGPGYVALVSTIVRGNAAEAAVLHALTRAGLPVLIPFGDGSAYDLAVDVGETMIKVQVKSGRVRGECIEFNTTSTDHGHGQLAYHGRADVFGVHADQLDRVYIVAVHECPAYLGIFG
jgi:PD-(D/E)XK endonuclease